MNPKTNIDGAFEEKQQSMNVDQDVSTGMEDTSGDDTSDNPLAGLTDNDLFNMVDPYTGSRYLIPYLSVTDPDYREQYIHYMKIKILQPELFQAIIEWK